MRVRRLRLSGSLLRVDICSHCSRVLLLLRGHRLHLRQLPGWHRGVHAVRTPSLHLLRCEHLLIYRKLLHQLGRRLQDCRARPPRPPPWCIIGKPPKKGGAVPGIPAGAKPAAPGYSCGENPPTAPALKKAWGIDPWNGIGTAPAHAGGMKGGIEPGTAIPCC